MTVAVYVRVSTQRQAQAQTIEQQLERQKQMAVVGGLAQNVLEPRLQPRQIIGLPAVAASLGDPPGKVVGGFKADPPHIGQVIRALLQHL